MKYTSLSVLLAASLMVAFTACIKTEFDEPPVTDDGKVLQPNTTIAELKALHVTDGGFDKITGDLLIGGVVVMDDRSGNYYKTLVIQDETGGIEVKFNDGFLYQRYPVGRTMYINCKDLYLGDYNGLTQLIGSVVEEGGVLNDFGLTEAQVRTKVTKGPQATPAPKKIELYELDLNLVSTLIEIEGVEFIKPDTGKTFADPVTQNSLNRTLENCDGLQLILRSSGFADFAAALTPRGKGTITGVLGIYNGTFQLYVRDLTDIKFDSLRCGEIIVPPTGLTSLNEPFNTVTAFDPADIGAWYNVKVSGNEVWEGRTFSGNQFVQASAFQANPSNVETWLITPPMDLRTQKKLSFRSSWGFYTHQGLSVWYSTDFNGSNAATATWQPLNPVLADANTPKDGTSSYSVWVNSGDVQLPVLSSKAYIGFRYQGNAATETATWRVDDVVIQ